jgi:hypothetical protein
MSLTFLLDQDRIQPLDYFFINQADFYRFGFCCF